MRASRMWWASVVISGVVVGRPAAAQKPTAAALVGQWAVQGDTAPALAFEASGAFTLFKAIGSDVHFEMTVNGKPQRLRLFGRWRLAGDTLLFDLTDAYMKAESMLVPVRDSMWAKLFGETEEPGYHVLRLVTLNGHILAMRSRDGQRTYIERVDPLPSDAATRVPEQRDTATAARRAPQAVVDSMPPSKP